MVSDQGGEQKQGERTQHQHGAFAQTVLYVRFKLGACCSRFCTACLGQSVHPDDVVLCIGLKTT